MTPNIKGSRIWICFARYKENSPPLKHLALPVLFSLITLSLPTSAQVGDLLWEDNFDTLNQSSWTIDEGNGCDQGLCGWGNQELQSYQPGNVFIQSVPGEPGNNALVLQAKRETVGDNQFSSGKIVSSDKLSVQYGMIEFRMRVPDLDTGYWPAVWMLGTTTLPWPNKGEIDMMEMGHRVEARQEWLAHNDNPNDDATTPPPINNFTGSNLIFYADAACSSGNPTCAASTAYQTDNAHVSNTSLADRFVTYRTYWTPNSIRFTVEDNGVEHDMYQAPFQISDESAAFREPFYLLMNMAIGGNFTSAAIPSQVTAPDLGRMYVDYIRVYEYDGHGSVTQGSQTSPETGTFGVFTDNTPTTNKLEPGLSSDVFLWDPNSSEGTIAALEGDNVISWSFDNAGGWFGGGVQTRQARDMTNFADGVVTFDIQIPADVSFRIGITDTFSNEHWLTFPAFETKYGLVRNGSWGQVTIPVADLRGPLVAIQSLQYMFAISSDAANLPASAFQYAIDDIVWLGGGNEPADTDGDGVADTDDLCPNTADSAQVDSVGCPIIVIQPADVRVEAEDYSNYSDTSAGNTGGVYRSDDVDIQATTDVDGLFNVGWIDAGEWLEYDLELGVGTYDVSARVASNVGGGQFSLSLSGASIGSDSVSDTGGWQNWQTHQLGGVTVTNAGSHTLRVNVASGAFNLNWIDLKLETPPLDSDGDGVIDADDQCPNTTAAAPVDSDGCEVPDPSQGVGVTKLDDQSVEFFVNTTAWADLHYVKNSGGQQNLRMNQVAGRNTYLLAGLVDQDQLSYWFTYFDPATNTVIDTTPIVYTHSTDTTPPPPPISNVALNKSASASSELQSASLAFDGDMATRWESALNTDPSWLLVDLGATYDLSQIVVHWEAANAANYRLEGSNGNNQWTTLIDSADGEFGDRVDTHGVSGAYRYVRMFGVTRSVGNNWGYSIWELEVFGSGVTNPDSDSDGVLDSFDNCPNTPIGTAVDSSGCPVLIVTDADNDGVPDNVDSCPNTPSGSTVDASGCSVSLGAVTPLFNATTALEADSQWDRGDALITRFSDRPRTRHAREDQYQSYDHYIKFYFENRSSNIEIVDYVAKGGDTIEMNVRTLWPLSDTEAENRWWYWGQNTVAHYLGNGIMDFIGFDGTYYNYRKTDNINRQQNRPIEIGDRLEFEISQFSRFDIPRGQANYYGTTYLYIVGKGIVPWYTENAGEFVAGGGTLQEDSREIPEEYRLGGGTTLHYQYTDEPNDNFMQMATNLGYDNAQKFLEGRRIHHSSFIDGMHDEDPENGVLASNAGLADSQHYVNERCTSCHERNGGAPVAADNELLDRWVFKVGDANGNPDPLIGRVLQPNSRNGAGEGDVSIAFWSQLANGLRSPNYQFSNGAPSRFSARIAPRLVGLGLLEAIPEAAILAKEDVSDANGDGISGRANRVSDPENSQLTRIGRFGWKAGASSIRHQAAAALNTDIGVRTSVLPNLDCGSAQTDCSTTGSILPDEELRKLTTYLATLGVRPQRGWESGFEDQQVVEGKGLFNQINCSGCHTPTLQTSQYHPLAEVRNQTIHPYSDLLLHDMGDGLADNLGEGQASGREWRTTPLWGLGQSACVTGGVINPSGAEGGEICTPHHAYLHDGRARSIEEAILWHGGESENSKNQYVALSSSQKQAVLKFLEAL